MPATYAVCHLDVSGACFEQGGEDDSAKWDKLLSLGLSLLTPTFLHSGTNQASEQAICDLGSEALMSASTPCTAAQGVWGAAREKER